MEFLSKLDELDTWNDKLTYIVDFLGDKLSFINGNRWTFKFVAEKETFWLFKFFGFIDKDIYYVSVKRNKTDDGKFYRCGYIWLKGDVKEKYKFEVYRSNDDEGGIMICISTLGEKESVEEQILSVLNEHYDGNRKIYKCYPPTGIQDSGI